MRNNKDKILKYLSENINRTFSQNDLQKELLPDLHKDEVKVLLLEIIEHNQKLIKVFKESSTGLLPVKHSGLINKFLSNGGFEEIERTKKIDEKKAILKEYKKDEILDLELKLKKFEYSFGKKALIIGIIITVLNFLITVLTLKFWNFDKNNTKQEIQELNQLKPEKREKETYNLN